VGLLTLLAAGGRALIDATQTPPEFYQQALHIEPTRAVESGEKLEEQVFAFRNQVKKPRRWSLRLTDEEINGWLASDLEEKFPHLLPDHVKNPRVAVQEKTILVGCEYKGQSLNSVLAVSLDIYLVEGEPNVVAIQMHDATAGLLPVPLSQLVHEIDTYAKKGNLPLRWQQRDGDPVMLITVPSEGEEIEGVIRVDALELREGEILLEGETIKTEMEAQQGASEELPFQLDI